ncbi:MAG: DinB family protein, partial [Terriglobales bacterium]
MTTSSNSLAEQLDEMRLRAEALVSGLTPAQLTKRPHPSKWSIAECIVHLNMTAALVQRLMEKAIARGKRENTLGAGPFDIGAKGRLLVW